jgi:hypothetical protein
MSWDEEHSNEDPFAPLARGTHDSDESEVDLRALTSQPGRHYCYACGTPWPDDWVLCEKCGNGDRALEIARPTRPVADDHTHFPGPWRLLPWPGQGAAAIYGGPGAGKSTLASMIRPTQWLTKEQAPKAAGDMIRRVTPDYMPTIHAVQNPEQIAQILSQTFTGPIVVDSLTAFGLREALVIAHLLVAWARETNERVLAILQVTKRGDAAGYQEITHLFDAICNVTPDRWGVRIFGIEKSRWSPLGSMYWTFDENGQVAIPDFPAAYSVEGSGGNYWLHPYPLKGSQWSGLLETLATLGLLKPGVASSAVLAPYMASRFVQTMDNIERRRFAEEQGLTWLEPEAFVDEIQTALEIHEISWADL